MFASELLLRYQTLAKTSPENDLLWPSMRYTYYCVALFITSNLLQHYPSFNIMLSCWHLSFIGTCASSRPQTRLVKVMHRCHHNRKILHMRSVFSPVAALILVLYCGCSQYPLSLFKTFIADDTADTTSCKATIFSSIIVERAQFG